MEQTGSVERYQSPNYAKRYPHGRPKRCWQRYRCPDCDGPGRTQMQYLKDKYIKCHWCGVPLVVVWDADGAGAFISENEDVNRVLDMGGKDVG
jgi:uncharacterized protein (DUF983 family)